MSSKIHSDIGRTVGIILHILKPLSSTVKTFVVYSGFCVVNRIVALAVKVVYGLAILKKRRYWTKSVPGDLIDRNFADKKVGGVDMMEDATEDGNKLRILCF